MPGYVIHIAVANEYIRKNNLRNPEEFIRGVIAPDDVEDKSLTHYGKYSSRTNLKQYLDANEINTDFDKGYFLHLLTDYLFYNYYFITPRTVMFYQDYDRTNQELILKYHVQLPERLQKFANCNNEEEPEILKIDELEKMIDEISDLDLEKSEREIKNTETITIGNKTIETNVFRRY